MSSAVNPPVANLEGVHISSGQPREAAKKKPRETGRKPEGTGRFPEGNRKAARKQKRKLVKHLRPGRFRKVSGRFPEAIPEAEVPRDKNSMASTRETGSNTGSKMFQTAKGDEQHADKSKTLSEVFPEGFRKHPGSKIVVFCPVVPRTSSGREVIPARMNFAG